MIVTGSDIKLEILPDTPTPETGHYFLKIVSSYDCKGRVKKKLEKIEALVTTSSKRLSFSWGVLVIKTFLLNMVNQS